MRSCVSIALVALVGLAGPASAEEWIFCGEDYWFTAKPPEGWELTNDVTMMGLTLTFMPKSGLKDEAITVIVPMGNGSMEPRAVNLDQGLMSCMSMINAFGAPARILDWEMKHPTQPTRSAVAEGESGRLYISVIDAGSGRGHTFRVMLATVGSGSASQESLMAFRSIVTSLAFDATRVCEQGPDNRTLEQRIEPVARPAATPHAPEEGFPIRRAMDGCATLQELFVPVYCMPARLEGRKAWVVSFDDGTDPAATYRDRFRDRITTPWCWAARGRGDAPRLFFTSKGENSLQEYSCASGDWGRSVPLDRLEEAD